MTLVLKSNQLLSLSLTPKLCYITIGIDVSPGYLLSPVTTDFQNFEEIFDVVHIIFPANTVYNTDLGNEIEYPSVVNEITKYRRPALSPYQVSNINFLLG